MPMPIVIFGITLVILYLFSSIYEARARADTIAGQAPAYFVLPDGRRLQILSYSFDIGKSRFAQLRLRYPGNPRGLEKGIDFYHGKVEKTKNGYSIENISNHYSILLKYGDEEIILKHGSKHMLFPGMKLCFGSYTIRFERGDS